MLTRPADGHEVARSMPRPERVRTRPRLEHSNSGKKVSIRFDSIRQSDKFAASTLIFKYGEFGEGPGGVSLRCGPFCAISVSIRQFPTS